MIIQILLTLVLSCLSGLFYRFGGMGKEEQSWVPMFLRKSWIRDWVIPAFSLGVLFTWWKPSVWQGYLLSIPVYLLTGGALSTYWDWINKFFGDDEGEKWYNWLLHGFFVGLAFFPFYWAGIHWWAILSNAVVSGLLMMWISERSSNVWIEECGRGFIATITRIFLLF